MTIKLFGTAALLVVALSAALSGGRALRERVAVMEELLRLLHTIRERIAGFCTPLPEIYAAFSSPLLLEIGFLGVLRQEGFGEALHRACLSLSADEIAVLSRFAEGLGRGYAETEIGRCDSAIGEFTAALSARREALPRAAKLYRTLLLSGALFVIIVLL